MIADKNFLSILKNNKHHSFNLQNNFNAYGIDNLQFYAIEIIKQLTISDLNKEYENNIIHSHKISLKKSEQKYLNNYNPELNVETDTFGKKHWK